MGASERGEEGHLVHPPGTTHAAADGVGVEEELGQLTRVQPVEQRPDRDAEVEGVDPHERVAARRELTSEIHVAAPQLHDRVSVVLPVACEHVPAGVPGGRALVGQAALGLGQPLGQGVDVVPRGHEANLPRVRWA